MRTYEFYVKAADYFFRKGNQKLFNSFYRIVKELQAQGHGENRQQRKGGVYYVNITGRTLTKCVPTAADEETTVMAQRAKHGQDAYIGIYKILNSRRLGYDKHSQITRDKWTSAGNTRK